MNDAELVVCTTMGRREAFGELVRRHGSSVRGLLRRMGADPAVADDVAQDAFVQAFQSCADFRGDGSFSAWVRRIAARRYLKAREKEARWVELEGVDEPTAPAPDQGRALDLDEALKSLSEVERVCVSLCHGAGMTQAEIASLLKLPLGTVKSHVKRGLDKLRARLEAGPERQRRRANV